MNIDAGVSFYAVVGMELERSCRRILSSHWRQSSSIITVKCGLISAFLTFPREFHDVCFRFNGTLTTVLVQVAWGGYYCQPLLAALILSSYKTS